MEVFWLYVWHFLKSSLALSTLSTLLSLIALYVSLRDRRAGLVIRQRKGDWARIAETQTGRDILFKGVIEIYNFSSRPNVIRDYEVWCEREHGWERMETHRYHEVSKDESYNETPLTLAPYSGREVKIMGLGKVPAADMPVRIEVEDLFGKHYRMEVRAFNRFEDQV